MYNINPIIITSKKMTKYIILFCFFFFFTFLLKFFFNDFIFVSFESLELVSSSSSSSSLSLSKFVTIVSLLSFSLIITLSTGLVCALLYKPAIFGIDPEFI